MKLRLNEEKPVDPVTGDVLTGNIYSIELPIAVCGPLNADFDGDAMTVHLVPDDEEIQKETYERMSPRYVNIYKKFNTPIYVPDHETLNGLALASEVVYKDPKELDDPKEFFDKYEDIIRAVEVDHTLDVGKPIVFTGKIGDEEYKNKITTPGRLRLSKIIGADIDKIKDETGKPVLDPFPKRISAGSGSRLYKWLYDKPDGVEKINELQKYGLHVVTVKGNVSFDFKTLYVDTDSETYSKIRKIVDDETLTDKQKLLMVNQKYKDYEKELEGRFDKDLKDELKRANRVKLTSIADINRPQIIISGVEEKVVVNHDSLYSGLSEKEYAYHAIENRSLLSIKQGGVPSSGYVVLLNDLIKLHQLLELRNLMSCKISDLKPAAFINLNLCFIMTKLEKITNFVLALGAVLTAVTGIYREYNNQQRQLSQLNNFVTDAKKEKFND